MGMLLRRYHNVTTDTEGVAEKVAPVDVVEEVSEPVEEIKYSKMDIYKMDSKTLHDLADKHGIEYEGLKVMELKKLVCNRLIGE